MPANSPYLDMFDIAGYKEGQPQGYDPDLIAYNNNYFNKGLSQNLQAEGGSGLGTAFGAISGLFGPMMQLSSGLSLLNDGVKMVIDGSKFQAGIYRESGKAAMQGAQFEASVLRQAGDSAVQISKYNIELDTQQTNRVNDALSKQIGDVLAANYAVAGATGASIYSKSTMMVQNQVAANAERMYTRNINDSKQRQAVMEFQGALTKSQYENQARGAEYQGAVAVQAAENNARSAIYQGKVSAYQQKAQASQAIGDSIGGMVKGVFSMFGGL